MGSSFQHDPARRLRLVGVTNSADELVLSNGDGEEFYLPITDALRNAATRPIGRPSAAAADEAAQELSPREIQAKLRAGASIQELADDHGLERSSLEVYATPIVAERDWIARQAQELEVAAPQLGNQAYEAVFGDEPALLGEMVDHRLEVMGLNPATVVWDAWRAEDSTLWTVSADFAVEGLGDSSIGDPPPAIWTYKVQSKHLENANRWAQVLSEFGPADSPVTSTAPRSVLAPVNDTPFDVESSADRAPHSPYQQNEAQEELLDVLHARRGQRLGVDEESDDELAAMITREEEPSPLQGPKLVVSDEAPAQPNEAEEHLTTELEIAWSDDHADDPASWDGREVVAGEFNSEDAHQEPPVAHSSRTADEETAASDDQDDEDAEEAQKKAEQPGKSRRRPTVPSWDEIIFGTRKDK